jgi:hypothetical protein
MPLFSYSLSNYARFAPPSPALVRSLVERATPVGDRAAESAFARAFDDRVEAERKSLILLFAPALALVLRLIFRRRPAPNSDVARVPRRYGEHLIFALHVLAFVWLILIGWGALAAALAGRTLHGTWGIVAFIGITLLLLATPAHVFLASRRAYALSRMRALVLTVLLAAAFVGMLVTYRALLFFTTYYTL